jgi:hypothetical protein
MEKIMKIKVEKKQHESAYHRKHGYNTVFTILESIHKTHFKALMKLSKMYDSKEKSGFILDSDIDKFDLLVAKIEKSNSESAKKSHQKTIEKAKARRDYTFEDYIEDFADQHIDLMSSHEKREWYQWYLKAIASESAENPAATENFASEEVEQIEDRTAEIFAYFSNIGLNVEKGENERYFLVKDGKAEGELIGVLSGQKINARFDKNEFGTTISIVDRSKIHSDLSKIYSNA